MLPDTLVVLGGNLAASAEIILRKTGVDICVAGEGEKIFLNIVRKAESARTLDDYLTIPGLVMLDGNGELRSTGYETPLDKSEIYDFEWSDLIDNADMGTYFHVVDDEDYDRSWLRHDPRAQDPSRRGKRVVLLPGAKGCVARFTFCHLFDKGIRYIPVERIMKRLEEVIEKYNVGFVKCSDENFGTDRRWLRDFCEAIKKYDILWCVAGMRVNCITPEQIEMMKDAGCVAIVYGMETGSPKMLEIMEKRPRWKATGTPPNGPSGRICGRLFKSSSECPARLRKRFRKPPTSANTP